MLQQQHHWQTLQWLVPVGLSAAVPAFLWAEPATIVAEHQLLLLLLLGGRLRAIFSLRAWFFCAGAARVWVKVVVSRAYLFMHGVHG